MADEPYDVIVIGAGPGGYVSAIRAAQLGLKTAIVEKRKTLGGTCLNIGCIPSKALLQSSHLYEEANHTFANHGIKAGKMTVDVAAMLKRKDSVVVDTVKGIDFLMNKNKITVITGTGTITAADEVTVAQGKKKEVLKTENIIIASGSDVAPLPDLVSSSVAASRERGVFETAADPPRV